MSAGSSMSARLVAAIIMMLSLLSKPSICTSSWLSVCSRSSWPPPIPVPRWRPTASISSIKIMQGILFLASSNKSRTRDAPTPTNISTKSEPDMEKNGTFASPATALANSVLPVPGGPTSSTPLGIRAPSSANFLGLFKNSTISRSSSFSSSAPATSENLTFTFSFCLVFTRPKFIVLLPPPPIWRIIIIITITSTANPSRLKPLCSQELEFKLGSTTFTFARSSAMVGTSPPAASASLIILE